MSKPPTRHWSGATKAPAVKRKRCRCCGAHVDEFTEPYGRVVRLDIAPPSVDVDLSADRDRLYEYHGPRVGWTPKFLPERGWRELRLVHECPLPTTYLSTHTIRRTRARRSTR